MGHFGCLSLVPNFRMKHKEERLSLAIEGNVNNNEAKNKSVSLRDVFDISDNYYLISSILHQSSNLFAINLAKVNQLKHRKSCRL